MSNKKMPKNLKRGRRVLDKYSNIEILEDFKRLGYDFDISYNYMG